MRRAGRGVIAESTATQSRHRLEQIRTRLEFVAGMKNVDAWEEGPLRMAMNELTMKMAKRPAELHRSSKLSRCIDDIETAREALELIANDLRAMSGWEPGT